MRRVTSDVEDGAALRSLMAELDRVIRRVEGVAGVLRRGEGEERRAVGLIWMWGVVGLVGLVGVLGVLGLLALVGWAAELGLGLLTGVWGRSSTREGVLVASWTLGVSSDPLFLFAGEGGSGGSLGALRASWSRLGVDSLGITRVRWMDDVNQVREMPAEIGAQLRRRHSHHTVVRHRLT